MKTILVTGAKGFMGRNLCVALRRTNAWEVLEFDVDRCPEELSELAGRADLVFHLAGVNRPKDEADFLRGNAALTVNLCECLGAAGRKATLVLSSSIQAQLDNPYGRSKKAAEEAVLRYRELTGARACIYRFPNVFGKWSRPNYNTVVATFCHNISRGLPVQLSNRDNVVRFVHIDDVVRDFLDVAHGRQPDPEEAFREAKPVHSMTLGELHDLLVSFREGGSHGLVPDLSVPLARHLYSTYVSFQDPSDLSRPVDLKTDDRGWLFELVKSPHAGQIFVSRTRPGITRGNHYHDSKIEKFCVIQGQGVIRFRSLLTNEVTQYPVTDGDIRIVDVPPGYSHSIENTGDADMLTLFWSSEIFDPQHPDTYFEKVLL